MMHPLLPVRTARISAAVEACINSIAFPFPLSDLILLQVHEDRRGPHITVWF